jgi:short-subunit dehydrogenase
VTLAQKRIVLTGGTGGLGQCVAAELLRQGADLLVLSRSRLADKYGRIRHVAVDLSTATGIADAARLITNEEPDILINLAGVQHFGLVEHQSIEAMQAGYTVNLVAPAALSRACLPFMKRRDAGQITNIGSMFGSLPFAHFAAYSSAKAGLRAFSEALRRELAGTDIAITYIAPRAIRTGMLTSQIQEYAKRTGMNVDPPMVVAGKIVTAITKRRKDVHIGFPERIFARLNGLLPRVVDAAVASGDRKAAQLFASQDFASHGGERSCAGDIP